MSGNRNWNDLSSDEEDSWFDDEDPTSDKKQHNTQPLDPIPQEQPKPLEIKIEQKESSEVLEKKQNDVHKQVVEKKKKSFLKEEQILAFYQNSNEERHVIKVVKCYDQENKNRINGLVNAKSKQIRDGMFILDFKNKKDLLQFIRDKIQHRYRFYLHPFYQYKDKNPNERDYKPKSNNQNVKRQRKPRYTEDQDDKQPNQQKPAKPRQEHKQQQKQKKVYVPKQTFQIQNKSNVLVIKSQNFQIEKVIEELQNKKIFKQFARLKIKTPGAYIPKVSRLADEISSKHKFNLEKDLPSDFNKEEIYQISLSQKAKPSTAKASYKGIKEKQSKPAVENKKEEQKGKEDPSLSLKKQEGMKARLLAGNYDQYFANISKVNLSEIVKGFDENQYVKRLNQRQKEIFEKNWNTWKIVGQQDFIEQLLKLTHRLKKSTIYDVELKPSMRNDKAALTAELKPRPQKERRPKVDVSGVNNYLN